jgi:recombination protein RecR
MISVLEELVEALCRLPTIGRKSAWRLALHLLERPEAEVHHLAQVITDARSRIGRCTRCFNYSETPLCTVCSSPSRDQTTICVVEKPSDLFSIEKSGRYRGTYHVLGGVLSPINGMTVDKLRIAELTSRIRVEHPAELILGLGGSADAETTGLYLARLYKDEPVKVTRFARGLPAGMELEYVDQITLGQALFERTDIRYGREG